MVFTLQFPSIPKFFKKKKKKGEAANNQTREEESSKDEAVDNVKSLLEPRLSVEEIHAVNLSLSKQKTAALPVPSDLMEKRMVICKELVARLNAHNFQNDLVREDLIWLFCDQSKQLLSELTWSCWEEEQRRINSSFPDFHFEYQTAVPISGAVAILGFRAGGTHTAAPYAFGPCEPIPSSGKAVHNDTEELYFFFREGEEKIAKIMVLPLGELTGPPGIYVQIGGFPMI